MWLQVVQSVCMNMNMWPQSETIPPRLNPDTNTNWHIGPISHHYKIHPVRICHVHYWVWSREESANQEVSPVVIIRHRIRNQRGTDAKYQSSWFRRLRAFQNKSHSDGHPLSRGLAVRSLALPVHMPKCPRLRYWTPHCSWLCRQCMNSIW